jgi:hypothetical protein
MGENWPNLVALFATITKRKLPLLVAHCMRSANQVSPFFFMIFFDLTLVPHSLPSLSPTSVGLCMPCRAVAVGVEATTAEIQKQSFRCAPLTNKHRVATAVIFLHALHIFYMCYIFVLKTPIF